MVAKMPLYRPVFRGYICGLIIKAMNLQDILAPIEALFLWTFSLAEMGSDAVNWLLILVIFGALVYWTLQLLKFESSELPNR
jgi:hypothetical protein